jgi:hypothetical protein
MASKRKWHALEDDTGGGDERQLPSPQVTAHLAHSTLYKLWSIVDVWSDSALQL